MRVINFAVLAIAVAVFTAATPSAEAGRSARSQTRTCILRSTQDFPAFRALVDDLRSLRMTRNSPLYEQVYQAALKELRADLRDGVRAVFSIRRLSRDPQINNRALTGLVSDLVDDLLIEPQNKAVKAAFDALSPQEKEKVDSQWAGLFSGTIISSSPGWIADMASELDKTPLAKTFVDVGSGHGIPSLLLAQEFPGIHFIGLDFVKAKIDAATGVAREMELENVEFRQQDLMAPGYELPVADAYYFFNPANPEVIAHVAKQIAEYSKSRAIQVFNMVGGWVTREFAKAGCKAKAVPNSGIEIITCY